MCGYEPVSLTGGGAVLQFKIAAGPRQRSHSQVRVPRDTWPLPHFLEIFQPGGLGPHIDIAQEEGIPVMIPGTGFPFRRLLRHAGYCGSILHTSTRDGCSR
jgi:hypothetical protein